MTSFVLGAYFVAVLLIGALSHRLLRQTGEDYFVAGRSIGPFVLLMSLFGTHMTSFALLGASAESYRVGIGVFALMASSSALMAPLIFLFLGTRVSSLGQQLGLLTPVQYFRERWQSESLAVLVFVALVALLIPYLLIGVMGGGITLAEITRGGVPQWLGSFLITAVVMVYVCYGGMRATAWVNTFQTLVFMVLGGVTLFLIIAKLGGLGVAMERLQREHPELLMRGENIHPLKLLTYTLIPLSVAMFPHIFTHWLSARRAETFRPVVIFYPVCIAVVWIPSVLLGIFGRIDFPDLVGPASNTVLVRMISLHAPEVLAGVLGAGVFAAIMSSLDSQSLSLGNMFTQDVVRHFGLHDEMGERQQVLVGRLFVGAVLVLTFLLSLAVERSIFGLAIWSFTGYAGLLPLLLAALFWKRSTASGAVASVLTTVVLWSYFFRQGWGSPDYSVGGVGVMPVTVVFFGSCAAMVVVSLLTNPPGRQTVARFFAAPEPGPPGLGSGSPKWEEDRVQG